MTIYYVKQDDTIWGCGDPECCGEYYEEIKESFVDCTCDIPEYEMSGDHLQRCNGGGPVLKWRKAKKKEILAFEHGTSSGHTNGWFSGIEWYKNTETKKYKPKRDRTVHQLVEEGYTVTIESKNVKEIHHAE